jgi:hypothetical protein
MKRETRLIKRDECSLASSCGEVKEKKRAQTLPSPLWKDRSGRLPETALSITSPRESFGAFQNAGPPLGFRPRVCNRSLAITPKAFEAKTFKLYADTGLVEAVWVRGDSIRP